MPGSPCCRWSRCRSRRVCRGGQRPGRQRMRGQPHGHRPGGDQHVQRPGEKTAPGPPPRCELGSLMTAVMNPRRFRWPRRAPRRGPSLRGAHLLLHARTHVLNDQLAGRLPPLVPGFTRCRIQLPSRRSLRHFVPLSYDCRGLPALAEVGDVSRMRQRVSDSLKRRRHTQRHPLRKGDQ